ncbi:MAG: ABC transporter permease, partial [Candidatus Neomarinimicrobiota bacterium]
MSLTFKIARRHLGIPQLSSFSRYAGAMAMTGLGLGIAALILTFSILAGFERTLSAKLTDFDGHIRIEHFMDQALGRSDALLDSALTRLPAGCAVYPYIQKPAILRHGQQAEGIVVEAYQGDEIPAGLLSLLSAGEFRLDAQSVVVGSELTGKMGLELGDKIILFDLANMHRVSSARRLGQFSISGIYHSGLQEYDGLMVYLDLVAAQRLFALPEQITGRVVFLDRAEALDQALQTLENSLGYPYFILSWKEKHRILFNWLAVQKWPILIIFGLIALVGVVNIVAALAMIVLEKIREIGILKSMG